MKGQRRWVLALGFAFGIPLGVSQAQSISPNFKGAFIDPVGATISGAGTSSITFTGGEPVGGLTFTAAADIHPSAIPFLLGKIEFTPAAAIASQVTFKVTTDAFRRDCEAESIAFSPIVHFAVFAEPGLRLQHARFSPAASSTTAFDGQNYTLAFAGLSETTVFDPQFGDQIGGAVGDPGQSAFLFATFDPVPTVSNSPPPGCDCHHHGVPEPSTIVLAITAAVCGFTMRKRRAAAVT